MAPVVRPGGPTTTRWSSSTPPAAPAGCRSTSAQTDVYYFAPQKSFAADGGLWLAADVPGRARAGGRDQGVRPLDPRLPRPVDRRRQLVEGPDLQHPGRRDAVPAGRPDRLAALASAASPARSSRTRESSGRLYGWAEKSEYATPFVDRPRRTGRWSSARSTSPTRSTPRPSRRRCAPTASSTPSPTASSAATSCGSACSRPSTPTTSAP